MENKLSQYEIKNLIIKRGLTIADVIDEVIAVNGIIGVGLVTLGEQLNQYCLDKIKKSQYHGN